TCISLAVGVGRRRRVGAGAARYVNTTLQFDVLRPSPGSLILVIVHGSCARNAADARVASVVKGVVGKIVEVDVAPDVVARPVYERVDLEQTVAIVPLDETRHCASG